MENFKSVEEQMNKFRGVEWCRTRTVLMVAIAVLVSSCAAPTFIPLASMEVQKIINTRVLSIIGQEEVTAKVERSNVAGAMGGGLIPALIDVAITSGRSKDMEAGIAPLKTVLSDYDFRADYWKALRAEASTPSRLKITEVQTTTKPVSDDDQRNLLNGLSENALLTIQTDYALTKDFHVLRISSTAELWIKGEKNPVYLETYVFSSPPMQTPENEIAAGWVDNHGEEFRKMARKGIEETMQMLRAKLLGAPGG